MKSKPKPKFIPFPNEKVVIPDRPIRWRHLDGLGFKHANALEPSRNDVQTFYKLVGTRFFFVYHGMGGIIRLTKNEVRLFNQDKMSIIPPGCCDVTNRRVRFFNMVTDTYQMDREAFMKALK